MGEREVRRAAALLDAVAPWSGARSDYPAPGSTWATASDGDFQHVIVLTVVPAAYTAERIVVRRLRLGQPDPRWGPEVMALGLFRASFLPIERLIQIDTDRHTNDRPELVKGVPDGQE